MIDLAELYRDLHAHPELGFAEHRTADIVAKHFEQLGLDVVSPIATTGVAGVLRNGDGPVVWLRADMDGLPVQEKTGLDYASTVTVQAADGADVPVMHACGHDMHVTWLLGALEALAADRDSWSGTVVAIGQPAEETIAGARAMIADGLLDRVPAPDVVLGQHVAPLPAGVISISSGAAMAGADSLSIVLHGRGGHGSRPETTIDPVVAAASLVLRLQTVVSRSVPPGSMAVLSVGKIAAGSKGNIIPDDAHLELSMRSVDPAVRATMLEAIDRVAQGEAAAAGMTEPATVTVLETAVPTVNDPDATARVRSALSSHLSDVTLLDLGTIPGSEDVAELALAAQVPLVFWFTGGVDPVAFATATADGTVDEVIPSNHSPYFAPVLTPTIDIGVSAMVAAARAWLAPAQSA